MGTWGEVEVELNRTRTPEGAVDFDGVRRGYLKKLAAYTKRNTIVYETDGFAPPDRKSTRLNSSHIPLSRMPSSA